MADALSSQERVDCSMSVNKNVTVPDGSSLIAATVAQRVQGVEPDIRRHLSLR
jgi:hypothetical protein